jgi:hypothetical protein
MMREIDDAVWECANVCRFCDPNVVEVAIIMIITMYSSILCLVLSMDVSISLSI